jgi:thiamine biosynthesis protein ThiI
MVTINNVTSFPVIRPLAVTDKLDIIKLSQEIETYDISIRPYEDCCTIFKPKKPKTRPKISECEYYESLFDWKTLLDECVENVNAIMIKDGEEVDFENK